MSRLFMLILTIAVGSCAGVGVIVALVMGYYTGWAIIVSAGIGAVVGVIVSWLVTRQILHHEPERQD